MNSRPRFSWSNLPQELLEIIAKLLTSRNDVCQFRAVCKHWRQSAPSSVLLNPLLPYNLCSTYPELSSSSLVLVATSVCLIQPLTEPTEHPWIATVEEFNSGKVFLRKPLSRTAYQELPTIDTINESPKEIPKVLDLSCFRVTELYKGYYLRDRDNPVDIHANKSWFNYQINKVVLFVDRTCGPNHSINDCTTIVLYNNGNLLALRLGEMEACVLLRVPKNQLHAKFDDVVNFKDKIYAVDRTGKTYSITYGDLEMKNVVSNPIAKGKKSAWKKWLVESSGELYLLNRNYDNKERNIQVYKLDEERCCWNKVRNLGNDTVIFVTFDGCFMASTKDFRGWGTQSCMLFYEGSFTPYSSRATKPDGSIAVYFFDTDISNMHGMFRPAFGGQLKVFKPPAWILNGACS